VKDLTQTAKDKLNKEKETETQKINDLDPIYYYDKNLAKFKLNLEYSKN
jgi:hypothetical protein